MQALKIVLVGDTGVGKSQLSKCILNKGFDNDIQPTLNMEFQSKKIEFEKCVVTSQIWDTAGQERYASMTRAYYRDAVAAVLVYDICNKDSLIRLETVWMPQLLEFGYNHVKRILVGNKSDKAGRDVTVEEAVAFAERHNLDFLEVSALSKLNVEKLFRRVSLSVAKNTPEIKLNLELLNLPEGWLALMPPPTPPLIRGDSDGDVNPPSSSLHSSSASPSSSLENSFKPPAAMHKANSFTDSPESFKPIGIDGHSRRRSLRDNSPQIKHQPPKIRYINYWTGEEVDETPTGPADPGLLFRAVEVFPAAVEANAAVCDIQAPVDDFLDDLPVTERSSSQTIISVTEASHSREKEKEATKKKWCCIIL